MQRFKSPGQAQRFLAGHSPIMLHFRPKLYRLPAHVYRQALAQRFRSWREITSMTMAA
jgi:putative transposase